MVAKILGPEEHSLSEANDLTSKRWDLDMEILKFQITIN